MMIAHEFSGTPDWLLLGYFRNENVIGRVSVFLAVRVQ